MASASNSPFSPVKFQNSPSSIHSCMSPAIPALSESSPSSPSLFCNIDQEYCMTSYSSTPSDSFPAVEARATEAEASCLVEATSVVTTGTDVPQPENGVETKKQAWNVPSNGISADISGVMGADSWPALSKSARASHKASSTDSLRALSHGSPDLSQVILEGSLSSQTGNNPNIPAPNLSSNHASPSRQRSMRRGGGISNQSSMTSNGSLYQAQPIHYSAVEVAPLNPGKSSISAGESPRDSMHKDAGQRGGTYGGNESHQQRDFRRSNSGPLTRGDVSFYHGNGRRDQERGKQDWNNSHRSFGRRGPAPQQRVGSWSFVRASVTNTPFISPSPVPMRPFVSPVVYKEIPSPVFYPPALHPESVRYLPFIPYHPMYYPVQDIQLSFKILSQIDYYFSNENLVKDTFLRQKMDGDGWVPINLIANFKKVTELTDDVQMILDAIQASTVVEVQGDKVRCKNDWSKWIIAPSSFSSGSTPQSLHTANQNMLAMHKQNFSLDKNAAA